MCDYRMELVKISAAVMGIEFSYAAETAFVSPTLLKIGENIVDALYLLVLLGYLLFLLERRSISNNCFLPSPFNAANTSPTDCLTGDWHLICQYWSREEIVFLHHTATYTQQNTLFQTR